MEIKIHARGVALRPKQEISIRKKFEKLTKFADRIGDESTEIRVKLTREAVRKKDDAFICILTLFVPNDTLRAESRSGTLETAIDEVLEKIKGPIERYKNKTHHISERK
jgi:ribosomal subunit interface protein